MPDVQKLLQDSVQAHFFPLPSLLPAKDFCHTEALQEPLPIPYCHNNENVVQEYVFLMLHLQYVLLNNAGLLLQAVLKHLPASKTQSDYSIPTPL